MKKLIVVSSYLVLIGCATTQSKETAQSGQPAAQPPKPAAHLVGYTLEEMPTVSCPAKLSDENNEKDLMKWASACVRTAHWKQVDELGNRLSIHFSMSPWGAYFLSLSADHAKDWPRARWMAELAAKNAPNEGVVLYQLGRVQWQMDERDVAFVTLSRAVDKNPSLVEAHVLMGQLALIDDKTSDARRAFTKAIERDPKHFEALMGMAEVGFRAKAWADVEKYLRMAIQSHPTSLLARLRLAEGQELGKKNSGALQTYQEIQKLDKARKLDAQPTLDIIAKVKMLQASVAEELIKKLSADRQPSDERKVSK